MILQRFMKIRWGFNEAYNRINAFITSNDFDSLDINIQENIAAFLISMHENAIRKLIGDGILTPEI